MDVTSHTTVAGRCAGLTDTPIKVKGMISTRALIS